MENTQLSVVKPEQH